MDFLLGTMPGATRLSGWPMTQAKSVQPRVKTQGASSARPAGEGARTVDETLYLAPHRGRERGHACRRGADGRADRNGDAGRGRANEPFHVVEHRFVAVDRVRRFVTDADGQDLAPLPGDL